MKRIITALAAILALSAAPAARAQAAAPGPGPTPHQIELAQQIVTVTNLQRNFHLMLQSFADQFTASFNLGDTPEAAKVKTAMRAAIDDQFDKMIPRMTSVAADIYARDFSEQELTDLLAFYNSPSGQAMLAKTPRVMAEAQAGVMPMVPGMQHDLIEDFCDRMSCPAQVRAQLLSKLPPAAPAH